MRIEVIYDYVAIITRRNNVYSEKRIQINPHNT